MPMIKWNPFIEPFEEMNKMMEEGMTPAMSKGFIPAIDIYQDKDKVYVETPLAGVDPNDVEISIENDVLIIRGESKKQNELDEKNYYRKEVTAGSFYRSVALPTRVVGDKATAESADGMLKIAIPKAAEVKPKTIKIKAKKSVKK